MKFGSIIPAGIDRPYTYGYQLRQQVDRINSGANSLRLTGLQQQYLVYKGLGSLGAKGLEAVSRQANQIAKRSLSPLEYASSRGLTASPLRKFSITV